MRKIILAALLFIAIGASAQENTLKYRISLKDKSGSEYSVKRPQEFLSQKAIQRRKRQKIRIDQSDLPVSRRYIDAIKAAGVKIVVTGKWDNFVTVSCNDSTLIDVIAAMPFVRSVKKVWKSPNKQQYTTKRDSVTNDLVRDEEHVYGPAYRQIKVSNGDKLHEAGFRGQGMTIAVIDGGFHNTDRIEALQNVNILGTKDFVNPNSDIYAENAHGMMVLSCMATNQPNVMIGTAPEASYWLLRSEDTYSEYPVEEDYAAAAIEFADSVGVDVINTSLGYSEFDDKSMDYRFRDLDGQTSLFSRQADRAANKGMIFVGSAGNAGSGSWKKITPPADAVNTITVGAIGKNKVLAPFSSIGNTADNRIKPDVVAVGVLADVLETNGELTVAHGTSFSSPIMCGMVACLWQACPELTAKEVIDLIRSSGDRADFPDNIYGYGLPDMWKAYGDYKTGKKRK